MTYSRKVKPSLAFGKLSSILPHFHRNRNRNNQFCEWHCKPNGVCPCNSRQKENQHTADYCAPAHRHQEGRGGLHQRLEIVGREYVKGQQQETQSITADNAGGNGKNRIRRGLLIRARTWWGPAPPGQSKSGRTRWRYPGRISKSG